MGPILRRLLGLSIGDLRPAYLPHTIQVRPHALLSLVPSGKRDEHLRSRCRLFPRQAVRPRGGLLLRASRYRLEPWCKSPLLLSAEHSVSHLLPRTGAHFLPILPGDASAVLVFQSDRADSSLAVSVENAIFRNLLRISIRHVDAGRRLLSSSASRLWSVQSARRQ